MKYFAEIQGSAHQLNGLLPALRNVDYDLRPGFNRYPLARYRTMGTKSLAVTLSCFFFILIFVVSVIMYGCCVMLFHVNCMCGGTVDACCFVHNVTDIPV